MNGLGIIDGLRKVDKRLSRRLSNVRKVLIDAQTPMNFAVIDPVFKVLCRDPRIDFYFTSSTKSRGAENPFGALDGSENIISTHRAAMLRFDAYIVADQMWAKLPRGSQRVYMFHGVAGKYADVYDRPNFSMRQWHRIFFINRRRLENFVTAGAIDSDSDAARLVGYPKLDCLVDGSLSRDDVLRSIGIEPTENVILYAPTWSPYSSLNLMGEDLVQQLCKAGYKVIVKLHDRSFQMDYQYSGGVNWAERLENLLIKDGGFLARSSDATPFLAAADVMITDHSSAGFEYLLVDRPLIRIEVPELIVETRIPEEYVSLMAEASVTVRTSEEAVRAVDRCLADPSIKALSRKAVSEDLFFDPGNATSRAVEELYQILELVPFAGCAQAKETRISL